MTPRTTRPVAVWLLIVGYVVLIGAWVFGNPPFASPDESHHHVRSLAAGHGDIDGEPARYSRTGLPQKQHEWVSQAARKFTVPRNLLPNGYSCNVGDIGRSAACQYEVEPQAPGPEEAIIPNGTYQPALYPVAGLVASTADDPAEANYLGRVAMALISLGLIVGAAFALSDQRSLLALVGLLAAMTPMAVYVSSTLSPSGPEVAAGVCLLACLVRLLRGPVSTLPLVGVAISGSILTLSKSLGPGLLLLIGVCVLAWAGWRRVWDAINARRLAVGLTAGVVALSAVANRIWEAIYGPEVTLGIDSADLLLEDMEQLPQIIRQFVGIFGYLEVSMPRPAYIAWYVAIGIVCLAALVVGNAWDRFGIIVSATLAAFVPILLLTGMLRHTGFGVQGRHTLAAAVALPILAGETLFRNRERLGRSAGTAIILATSAIAGAVHLTAWYYNARRAAVGADGPVWFAGLSEWVPPGGWIPWSLLAAAGAGSLLLSGLLAAYPRSPETLQRSDRNRFTTSPARRPASPSQ